MKRKISIFILLLGTLVLLAGCSSKDLDGVAYNGDDYGTVDTEPVAPAPVIEDPDLSGGDVIQSAVIPALENRKIIYTANLSMTSDEPSEVYNTVINNLDTYSAYIESAQINSTKYIMKIRVLSVNFTDFVEAIKTTGDVVSFSKTSDDITNSYSTFEARKLALETQQAVDLEDILTLEDARFDIETELNEIGASLANYDSLVDFSTINLVVNKATETVTILPITSSPQVNVIEITKSTIDLEVYNTSDQPVIIYVDLLQNGEFIRQYDQEAYGDSSVVFEIDDIKSFKEYTFKVTTIAADHRVSSIVTREAITDKTFINRVTNVFVTSFNTLVSLAQFIGLTVVAVSPYVVVGLIFFYPVKIAHNKYRNKYPKKDRVIKVREVKSESKHL